TATAVSAARRASSAYRARSRELVFASGIGRAEYSDARQQIVQVERFGDHIGDAALGEVALVLICRRADEEHRHLTHVGVGANAVEYLEAVESRHHDVEDEKGGVDVTHGLDDRRAV